MANPMQSNSKPMPHTHPWREMDVLFLPHQRIFLILHLPKAEEKQQTHSSVRQRKRLDTDRSSVLQKHTLFPSPFPPSRLEVKSFTDTENMTETIAGWNLSPIQVTALRTVHDKWQHQILSLGSSYIWHWWLLQQLCRILSLRLQQDQARSESHFDPARFQTMPGKTLQTNVQQHNDWWQTYWPILLLASFLCPLKQTDINTATAYNRQSQEISMEPIQRPKIWVNIHKQRNWRRQLRNTTKGWKLACYSWR